MSEFDYKMCTHPGTENGNTDALSHVHYAQIQERQMHEEMSELQAINVIEERKMPSIENEMYAIALPRKWIECDWYRKIYMYLETMIADGETMQERRKI